MAAEFCNFSKFGFCKFGNKCRRKHFNAICEHYFCENVKTSLYFCIFVLPNKDQFSKYLKVTH